MARRPMPSASRSWATSSIGFDLVASGINYGANLGDDITYSGTVSAAMEAVINDVPGVRDLAGVLRASRLHAGRARSPIEPRPTSSRTASARGELHQHQRAGRHARGVRGRRGHAHGQARLPGRADRAARSARHPLLLDRRSATIRARRCRAPTSTRSSIKRIAVTPIQLDLTGRSLLKRLRTWSWPIEEVAEPTEVDAGAPSAAEAGEEQAIEDEQAVERR